MRIPLAARPSETVRRHLLDASPSWRLRCIARSTRIRIDLPMSAHDPVKVRCSMPVRSDRFVRTMGTTIALNPWDGAFRFGIEYDF